MDKLSLNNRLKFIRCPACRGALYSDKSDTVSTLVCSGCKSVYHVKDKYISMLPQKIVSDTKIKIQNFWGDTCAQWYNEFDKNLTSEILYEYLDDLEKMFRYRGHLAVNEITSEMVNDVNILEIGSGGGAHSALFKKYGAHITSIDITAERVISTATKLDLIKEGTGLAMQADAENLPFEDSSFAIVYSNGVLHHSENTEKCIKEIHRVLEPGGKAVIMLYSRHSALYWLSLFPKSILYGLIFRNNESERIGILTEGKPRYGETKNPVTRVYSEKEINSLFDTFKMVSIRKNSFSFAQIPIINHFRDNILNKFHYKPWKSGIIVYGKPFYAETEFELSLGTYIGFCWNIVVKK